MKKITSLLIALLCMLTATAQNASEARSLLDKAAAKISIKSGATANFTISGGKLGNQSGTISVKGNKFNARTAAAIVWYDGKTQWFYSKKNNEVNVSHPGASQSMNPYTFLSLYKQGYTLSLNKSASGNQVHLVGKGKSISEMYILLDGACNIKQVKMKQGSQWITINVTGLRSQSLPDSAFQFNSKEFPKAEVIDLR